MPAELIQTRLRPDTRAASVALVGNPNAGKSTLFNALTGRRQRVANYPGTTVERRVGAMRSSLVCRSIDVIDLPGTYSLAAGSIDEAVVLDVLLGRDPHTPAPSVIVCVVDGTNLPRHLFLTTQILELGLPVVVALTMTDLLGSTGRRVDAAALAGRLGVSVVPVVGTTGKGIAELARAIEGLLERPSTPTRLNLPSPLEAEVKHLAEWTKAQSTSSPSVRPVEIMQTLLNPGGYHERQLAERFVPDFEREVQASRRRLEAAGLSLPEIEAQIRYAWIDEALRSVCVQDHAGRDSLTERADRFLTHPGWGLLVLMLSLAVCFQAIYAWSAPLMDFMDGVFRLAGRSLTAWLPAGALQSLLVDGVVAGVGATLMFLPQIVILFLFIAIVEDCGYLARAAFLLDRWMHLLGLPGKAFIPLLSSFACAVPGIMATRVIEERRDRLVTILIAPLMSCSARLPVYTLLIGAFVPAQSWAGGWIGLQAVSLLAMYLLGGVVAIPVAWLLKHTLLKGPPQPFLMELPGYRWPSARTVFFRVYDQGKAFCVSAGTLIFAVTVVVWALGYYPRPKAIAQAFEEHRHALLREQGIENVDWVNEVESELGIHLAELEKAEAGAYMSQSILGRLGSWIEPAVAPLGWDWRIGTAALASFPAREVVIATLGTIYNLGGDVDESAESLRQTLAQATWPDGRPVYNLAVALSIMVFFALCCQCGATLAIIKRETNSWRWPLFTFGYMTGLAYLGALVTYQSVSRFL